MFVELSVGGEGPWVLEEERFDAAPEGGVVGRVILDVLINQFVEAAKVCEL